MLIINQVIGDLLLDGPSAPFYKSLIEPGIGAGFSPVSGFNYLSFQKIFKEHLTDKYLKKSQMVDSRDQGK